MRVPNNASLSTLKILVLRWSSWRAEVRHTHQPYATNVHCHRQRLMIETHFGLPGAGALGRAFVGSFSDYLVHQVDVPVLVAKTNGLKLKASKGTNEKMA
mmetsp:Transcript_20565/g.39780  ORF Transcript_20565/g.39780 Transcript_20565/m.39780 type:complete len:100 (-) Transcript_20565:176-475(-)